MRILKGNGINWQKKIDRKLQMDSGVKVRLEQGETRSVKIVKGVKARMLFVTVYFNVQREYMTTEALEVLRVFKIGELAIPTVKYADYPLLLAKENTVLQGMQD
jgi:hypothetical protein